MLGSWRLIPQQDTSRLSQSYQLMSVDVTGSIDHQGVRGKGLGRPMTFHERCQYSEVDSQIRYISSSTLNESHCPEDGKISRGKKAFQHCTVLRKLHGEDSHCLDHGRNGRARMAVFSIIPILSFILIYLCDFRG
ncbi:uncharacterized protein BO97DRAFT_198115 [Aspergillus homomorphus CBS 101889]|uniref:Uncharacterized protein n=1 Tax=Aspergillus homomorphus (strain CBS 101889) TaxID=1450537 RepID=A0A395HLN8_ASPHC|nr:hypothetical protein BO97DRAFT_198115 [Aspergillus homomorphus CBS 101889]RAL08680.1 hypothetical protein BO97DRAFT_198115 [Aspergillus homomorphus CBS 101889]